MNFLDSPPSLSVSASLHSLPVLVLAATLAASSMASAQETYTFESLTLNGLIHGQDNWVDKPGQGQAAIWAGSGVNGTKVVGHVPTVAFNQSAFISRVNDGSFSFPPILPSALEAGIQFDCSGDFVAMFALGTDLDGDGILGMGEIGPAFGTYDRSFRVERADFGSPYAVPFGSGNSKDDWYRIRLEIDLAANGGDGAGSLSYLNLTDGDTSFIAIPGLQDLDLGLGAMNPAATPASWDTMWLHLLTGGGNIPFADNLEPNAMPPVPEPGAPYCFGDPGSGTPCPCNNDNDGSVPGSGCANGTFPSGAQLTGSGVASVSADTLVLTATGSDPNNTGLYFQANNAVNGGQGIPFGDGLRCAGGGLIRLEIRIADATGTSSTSVSIATDGRVAPGDTKRYQCWYRDTSGGQPCGVGVNDFNLSNGYEVVWSL